jgi:hypothetical protein
VDLRRSAWGQSAACGPMVRGAVVLPHGTGSRRVLVFAKGERPGGAAGADLVGEVDRDEGPGRSADFDRVIATPDMMGLVESSAHPGPRGLMPNPARDRHVRCEDGGHRAKAGRWSTGRGGTCTPGSAVLSRSAGTNATRRPRARARCPTAGHLSAEHHPSSTMGPECASIPPLQQKSRRRGSHGTIRKGDRVASVRRFDG